MYLRVDKITEVKTKKEDDASTIFKVRMTSGGSNTTVTLKTDYRPDTNLGDTYELRGRQIQTDLTDTPKKKKAGKK